MTTDDWKRVKEVFFAACDLPAAQRQQFIERECANDSSIQHAVMDLLAHDDNPATLLRGGSGESGLREHLEAMMRSSADARNGNSASAPLNLPERIGRYRVVALLGEGGMGVVYLAEQDRPHRKVALKVIAPGRASGRILRRFQHEAEILGRLHHPGIAQIFEAGTHDDGRGAQPYFAMELIEGQPLTKACDRLGVNQRARLELFIAICDAVEHAHQQGVIHRDLKPANILVVEQRTSAEQQHSVLSLQPKILDFGVARLTGSDQQATTMHTAADQIIGTVAYMSPEQLSGQTDAVDARTDIYSLGVILFELLTGRLPHDTSGLTIPQAIRVLGQDDATTLTSVSRRFRGDLDTIVRKALERDKQHRYGSAGELAADVRRFLRDDPIHARPPSTIYQLRKFARRHKAVVTGVAAVFIVLIAGIVATSWQARQAIAARDEQIVLRKKADASATRATVANDFLRRMLASAQPASAKGDDVTVGTVLDAAALEIESGAGGMTPDVEALIRLSLAETYLAIGRLPKARVHAERAVELSRQLYGEPSAETAAAQMAFASVLSSEGDRASAISLFQRVLEDLRTIHGGDHDDIAVCLGNLAECIADSGAPRTQFLPLMHQSLEMLVRLHGESSIEVADCRSRLAGWLHNPSDAEPLLNQAIETYRTTLGERHPKHIQALRRLGGVLLMRGALDESLQTYEQAAQLSNLVYGEEHPATCSILRELGFAYRWTGRHDKSLEICERVARVAPQVYGPESTRTLEILMECADARAAVGDAAGSIAGHRQAIELADQTGESSSLLVCVSRLALADLVLKSGLDAREAAIQCQTVIDFADITPGMRPWMQGQARSLLGEIAIRNRSFAEAETLLIRAFDLLAGNSLIAHHYRECAERLVRLYDAWHEAEPGGAKDEQAKRWRERLSELPAPKPH